MSAHDAKFRAWSTFKMLARRRAFSSLARREETALRAWASRPATRIQQLYSGFYKADAPYQVLDVPGGKELSTVLPGTELEVVDYRAPYVKLGAYQGAHVRAQRPPPTSRPDQPSLLHQRTGG